MHENVTEEDAEAYCQCGGIDGFTNSEFCRQLLMLLSIAKQPAEVKEDHMVPCSRNLIILHAHSHDFSMFMYCFGLCSVFLGPTFPPVRDFSNTARRAPLMDAEGHVGERKAAGKQYLARWHLPTGYFRKML